MTVLAPSSLCVPSGKSIASTTAPPLAKGLDNERSRLLRQAAGPGAAHIRSRVDSTSSARRAGPALQPLTLCAPVQINGSPLINATIHLVCYGVKLGPNVKPTHVSIHNRFGVSHRDRSPAPVAARARRSRNSGDSVYPVAGRGAAWLAR